MLDGQKNLIENVERNEQQAEPRNGKQARSVRGQQQGNQEIPGQEIKCRRGHSDPDSNNGPIILALGIPRDFPRQNPVASHQSQVTQNHRPENDRGEFTPGNGPQQTSRQDTGRRAACLDHEARRKCSEIGFGKNHSEYLRTRLRPLLHFHSDEGRSSTSNHSTMSRGYSERRQSDLFPPTSPVIPRTAQPDAASLRL